MGIHRLRLSDEEIGIIKDSLQVYFEKVDKQQPVHPQRREISQLLLRFIDWGTVVFRRPRKRRKWC